MRASATAHNASRRYSKDIQHMLSDVEDLLNRVTNIKDIAIDDVRQRLTDSVAAARESLRSSANGMQKRAGAAVQVADGYAHDSPWLLAGIAAFAGLTMGLWLSRR